MININGRIGAILGGTMLMVVGAITIILVLLPFRVQQAWGKILREGLREGLEQETK